MYEFAYNRSYKLRLAAGCLFVACGLLVLPFIITLIWAGPTANAVSSSGASQSKKTSTNNSPNIITSGLFNFTSALGRSAGSTQNALVNFSRSSEQAITGVASGSFHFIAWGTAAAVTFPVHLAASGVGFVSHFGKQTLNSASQISVSSIIRPADVAASPTPTIDVPAQQAATTAPTQNSEAPVAVPETPDTTPQWPIHGYVTLGFGVPHWPFQPTHTGIDISDGAASGVTLVHPFRPGTVIEADYNSGFGNHVIIDHGGGLTSLYGHMSSLLVHVGQKVDKNTALGYEGSTGESTGVHVHFEIDVNGVPTNPRNYVSGQPG